MEFLRKYSEGILLTLLLAFIVRLFVVSSLQVASDEMAPTLLPGDHVVSYKLPYGIAIPLVDIKIGKGIPRRGDIVTFDCPGNRQGSCASRVIGLPGDRVEIKRERLILNGITANYGSPHKRRSGLVLDERVLGMAHKVTISGIESRASFGPVIVGPERAFLLSDHRDLGLDSREYGTIPFSRIRGRLSFVWLSWEWPDESSSFLPAPRWSRVFKFVNRL